MCSPCELFQQLHQDNDSYAQFMSSRATDLLAMPLFDLFGKEGRKSAGALTTALNMVRCPPPSFARSGNVFEKRA